MVIATVSLTPQYSGRQHDWAFRRTVLLVYYVPRNIVLFGIRTSSSPVLIRYYISSGSVLLGLLYAKCTILLVYCTSVALYFRSIVL